MAILRPCRRQILGAALLSLLALGCALGLIGTSAYLIGRAAQHPASILLLLVPIVGVRFFSLGRAVSRYAERVRAHDVTLRVLARLKGSVFARLERLAPLALLSGSRGDWLRRLGADVDRLESFYIDGAGPALALSAGALAAPAFLAVAYAPVLGGLLLLGLVVAGVVLPLAGVARLTGAARRLPELRGTVAGRLVDVVAGMADLAAMGAGARLGARVLAAGDEELATQLRVDRGAAVLAGLLTLVAGATALGLTAVGAELVRRGTLPGVLLAVVALFAVTAFEVVTPVLRAYPAIGESVAAMERLSFAGMPRRPGSEAAGEAGGDDIAVDHLYFRYDPGAPWLLEDVTASIPAGGRVLLTGPSGEGKSTLVALLAQLVPYRHGSIRLGGAELSGLAEAGVRRRMAVVSQRTHLFAASLERNLSLGRPGASAEELEAAVRRVHLDALVATLPQGLKTPVGRYGRQLSGGEAQRVAVARLLLAGASILLLDEPTAGLDAATAQAVQATLREIASGRTVLYVTHEPLVGWDFDAIWHLADGRLTVRRG